MNQHIKELYKKPDDPVARLRLELAADAAVKAHTGHVYPHFAKVPAKRRPIPTGWENRKGVLS